MKSPEPGIEDVVLKLDDLAKRDYTAEARHEVSRWAMDWILHRRDQEWTSSDVFEALTTLGMVDLMSDAETFLYGPADFAAWTEEFTHEGGR
jgi:hypothetical protein